MAEDEGLDRDLMVEVWRLASRIVAGRPWLLASWVDDTANIPHIVVHDGPLGAALHFDDEEGPYWSGGFTRRLTWEQVASRSEPEEWATAWGHFGSGEGRSARAEAYGLISAFYARWLFDVREWDARPAPILGEGTSTVFDLHDLFPTAEDAVQIYLRGVSAQFEESAATGQAGYWHEPFWLIRRDGEPRLLVDESGMMHLPVTTVHHGTRIQALPGMGIKEVMAHGETATSLASNGYSIDLATAISRAGGVHELAELCDRGVAAVIFALEPPASMEEPRADDVVTASAEDRSHWGWDYEGRDYVLAWLNRAKDPDLLAAWHEQEAARHRRIAGLRDFSHSGAPALDLEARADDPDFPLELASSGLAKAVTRHLTHHLLPPVPESMVPACIQALGLVKRGEADQLVALPEGVTYADQAGSPVALGAPAREVVRQHSLSNFLRPYEEAEQAWDLSRALDAWDEAERGEWEIPSPAPTWPEYVTLLLVGRNHLVPGVEDDSSERDMLRSWWISEAGDWDRMHDESWWSAETAEVMNLPDNDPPMRRELTLRADGMDPLASKWIDLMGDLAAAKSGRSPEERWSDRILEILTGVRSAGSFSPDDLGALEEAFVAAFQGRYTSVVATEVVDADLADLADAVSTSIASVGMGFGWSLPEKLYVEYAMVDVAAGYADLTLSYVGRGQDSDEQGEARLELIRAGSGVLMIATEEVPAGQAAAPEIPGGRWLPQGSRSSVRHEIWAEVLSGVREWYFHMAMNLRGPREHAPHADEYLVPVRREVDRALGYAKAGRFADAEIVLESTFDGWTEVSPELVQVRLSAEAELAHLMGRDDDATQHYRELVDFLGSRTDPGALIEITTRALRTARDDHERSAWLGYAMRVIAFASVWHPEAPAWRREVERLRDQDVDAMPDETLPTWRESTLTPAWDGSVGTPSLIVVVGSDFSRGVPCPTRAHSALSRLERELRDDMLVLAGGSDDLLRLAGVRRLVQLGRSGSPREIDHVASSVRTAIMLSRRVVFACVDDIDEWRAAQPAFAPKSELKVLFGSDGREREDAVASWVADELNAIAHDRAMRDEEESRRRLRDG